MGPFYGSLILAMLPLFFLSGCVSLPAEVPQKSTAQKSPTFPVQNRVPPLSPFPVFVLKSHRFKHSLVIAITVRAFALTFFFFLVSHISVTIQIHYCFPPPRLRLQATQITRVWIAYCLPSSPVSGSSDFIIS